MELKIVYGRSGSGKTTYVFNEIKKKIVGNKKIYIIVPEQISFSAEKHLLDVIEDGSSINAEVLTLSRMADRVIEAIVGNRKVHLSNIGKSMIVYDVLETSKKEMNFLSGSDKNLELALNMITEFKKHSVKADVLNNVEEKIDDKYLKLKIDDTKNILQKYQEKIEKNYIDESDRLELLAQNIEESNLFNDDIFFIDEFAGFTPNEYKIIEKLCMIASQMMITICTDSVEDVDNTYENLFYFNNLTCEKLLEIASKTGAFVEKINLGDSKRTESKELKFLEKNIYSENTEKYENKNSDISLFCAKNYETEIRNVARNILELVKNKDYRYKDFAVVCANIDTYSSDVKNVFERYNIPIFIDEKKDITNNILMKYIISLLNVISSGFSYEAMFSYIKSGVLNLDNDDIFILEKYVNKWGIRGNKWYKEDFSYEEKNDLQERVNNIRKEIIAPILEFKNSFIGEKTAKEICENLFEFIEKNKIQHNILNLADILEKEGNLNIADEYRSGIKLFFDVLDEIVIIFEEEKMSFERFNKILQVGISRSELGKIPASFDQVLFGDIERSKTKDIKVLFLIGLNDGAIPVVVKDEGFFNDKDRELLKEYNVELAKNSIELLYENQFNIYKILSTAKDKLFLSYSSSDKEGKALRKSILITQIKKIFPDLVEDSDVLNERFDVSTKNGTLDGAIEKYQSFLDDEEIEDEWKNIIAWYEREDKERVSRIFRAVNFTNLPQVVSAENVKKMYGDVLKTSVSRLEQYRKCPFSFHLKYGLKLKVEDEFKIRALDSGNFMHDVIDEVFTRIEKEELLIDSITKEDLYKIISDIIVQKLGMNKNFVFSSSPKFIALTRKLKMIVYQSIDYIIEQLRNSKFKIYGHELEFSEKAELKPMKMELEDGKRVIVTGKIDRVDIAQMDDKTYVRIIDYKSSVHDIDLGQVVGGIQLQLLTYLDEVEEQKGFEPAGVLYFNLLDNVIKSSRNMDDERIKKELNKQFKMKGLIVSDVEVVKMMDTKLEPSHYSENINVYMNASGDIKKSSSALDKEKFEKLQKYTKHLIEEISKEIFSGNVDIKPFYKNKRTACELCDYRNICNFDPKFKNNRYRYIKNITDEDLIFDGE